MKHFYIISATEFMSKDGLTVKLGFAQNVSVRLSQLQSGNHIELQVLDAGLLKDAANFEKFIHRAFKDKKIRGEWYWLSEDEIHMLYKHVDNARVECTCKPCLGFYVSKRAWRNNPNWALVDGSYEMTTV